MTVLSFLLIETATNNISHNKFMQKIEIFRLLWSLGAILPPRGSRKWPKTPIFWNETQKNRSKIQNEQKRTNLAWSPSARAPKNNIYIAQDRGPSMPRKKHFIFSRYFDDFWANLKYLWKLLLPYRLLEGQIHDIWRLASIRFAYYGFLPPIKP